MWFVLVRVIKWLFRVVPWGVLIDRVKPIYRFIEYHLMGREGIDGLLLSAERTGSPPSTPGFAASIFYKVRIISQLRVIHFCNTIPSSMSRWRPSQIVICNMSKLCNEQVPASDRAVQSTHSH